MKKLNYKLISIVIGLIAISGLAVYYVFAAWTPPTAAPPGANVPAPINVSTTTQTFLGNKRLNFTTTTDVLSLGPGLGVDGVLRARSNLIVDGRVGIGTATPQTRLDVAGAIRVGSQDICNAANAGAIRYISTLHAERFEGCNGTSWEVIAWVRQTPPPGTKRIFITSSRHTGNLGGLAGADRICMTRAREAGLHTSWTALLSDSTVNARDRIHYNWHRLVRMDGKLVATSKADLWDGTIASPILINERGESLSAHTWTGTDLIGMRRHSWCNDWRWDGADWTGWIGSSWFTSREWIDHGGNPCNRLQHLYCIEQ